MIGGNPTFVSDSLMYNFKRENPFIHARITFLLLFRLEAEICQDID